MTRQTGAKLARLRTKPPLAHGSERHSPPLAPSARRDETETVGDTDTSTRSGPDEYAAERPSHEIHAMILSDVKIRLGCAEFAPEFTLYRIELAGFPRPGFHGRPGFCKFQPQQFLGP